MKTPSGRTKAFNLSFYPCSIKEWCALSEEFQNVVSVNIFKQIILSFIRLKEKRTQLLQYMAPKISDY